MQNCRDQNLYTKIKIYFYPGITNFFRRPNFFGVESSDSQRAQNSGLDRNILH